MSDEQPHRRKTRTRGHIIAALGVNHVERQILLAGYVPEREHFDYGLDVTMKTFDSAGQVEPGRVLFQVKATDHFAPNAVASGVAVRVDVGALKGWLMEATPVVLVLYDAQSELAYWLDVQEYAREHDIDTDAAGATASLVIPLSNVFTAAAARQLRDVKEHIDPQMPTSES